MDIKTICSIGSLIFSLCTFFGGGIAFCVLKFNDFKHLEKNYDKTEKAREDYEKKITEKLDKIIEAQSEDNKAIAVIQAGCKLHKV